MARPKLTRFELQILDVLWRQGNASIREIQELLPNPRAAYTTVQTTVYRLERKTRYGVSGRSATPIFSSPQSLVTPHVIACSMRF
jgi:hypothetical protein